MLQFAQLPITMEHFGAVVINYASPPLNDATGLDHVLMEVMR